MKLFPWAKYTRTKGGIKLHTALDLQLALPVVMNMTNAKVHDSKATREIIDSLPPFSVVVMDRGYNDYSLFHEAQSSGHHLRHTHQGQRQDLKASASEGAERQVGRLPYGVRLLNAPREVCGGEVFHTSVQWYDEENDRWFDFFDERPDA